MATLPATAGLEGAIPALLARPVARKVTENVNHSLFIPAPGKQEIA